MSDGSLRYKVSFETGEPREFKVKPRHLVAYEMDGYSFDENEQSVYSGYLLAFYAAGQPGSPSNATADQRKDAYLAWLDGVDSIETLGAQPASGEGGGEAGEAVPTP